MQAETWPWVRETDVMIREERFERWSRGGAPGSRR
jgi:hypothetical protein